MDDTQDIVGRIQSLAESSDEANKPKENGPGDVQPTTETKVSPLVTLKMSEDEIGEWFTRIKRSQERRRTREEKWDTLLKEFLPIVTKSGEPETVKMNLHFRNIYTKMASLFYQKPDLILTAKDPGPSADQIPQPMPPGMLPGQQPPPPLKLEDLISIKQAVLNDKLGPEEIDVEELFDQLLFDQLGWAGICGMKIGYRCITKSVSQPKLIQNPIAPAMGAMGSSVPNNLVPDPSGETENIPVPIFEEWYMRHFSPKKLLLDDALYTPRVAKDSTWIGMEFFMSPARAQKSPELGGLGLSEDDAKAVSKDDRRALYDDDATSENASGLVHGYEIYCLASVHGDNNPHPKAINQLVLLEGITDKTIIWRPCVDQTFDQTGKLTPDSIDTFPILTGSLRTMADTPYSLSDAAFTNSHIKQISTWRRQSVKMRDSAQGRYLYDKGAFDTGEIDMLKNGEVGDMIGVESGRLAQGADKVIAPVAQAHMTPDDYKGMELLKRDHDEMLGIGATQSGTPEQTVQTATQIAQMSQALASRNRKEQAKVISLYLKAVRMLDQLLMRYATETDYVLVGGDEASKKPMLWNNKVIKGRYLYEITPDSQLQADTEVDFRMDLQLYNLTAGDPLANRLYILKRLMRQRRMDPSKATLPPPPPHPTTPKPNVSVTLKGEDLMVIMDPTTGAQKPVNPIAYDLVMSQPIPPVPEGFAGSLPPHGGPGGAANKHEQTNTGHRPNEPGAVNQRKTDGV